MPKIFKRKFGKLREKILLPFTRNSQLRVSLPEFVSSNQKRTRQMGLGNSGTNAHKMHKYYLQAWYYSTFLDTCHQIPKLSPKPPLFWERIGNVLGSPYGQRIRMDARTCECELSSYTRKGRFMQGTADRPKNDR